MEAWTELLPIEELNVEGLSKKDKGLMDIDNKVIIAEVGGEV